MADGSSPGHGAESPSILASPPAKTREAAEAAMRPITTGAWSLVLRLGCTTRRSGVLPAHIWLEDVGGERDRRLEKLSNSFDRNQIA